MPTCEGVFQRPPKATRDRNSIRTARPRPTWTCSPICFVKVLRWKICFPRIYDHRCAPVVKKNTSRSDKPDCIRLRGVRQNNLKGFDLDLPLGKFIVVTEIGRAS